jgi:hypothetical protein
MNADDLTNFVAGPGLTNLEKAQEVLDFLTKFNNMLYIYRAAYGEPLGYSVEMNIKNAKWYVDHFTKSE